MKFEACITNINTYTARNGNSQHWIKDNEVTILTSPMTTKSEKNRAME